MQVLTRQGNRLQLAEIIVTPELDCCGKSLDRTDLRANGIIVVAHQKPGGEYTLPPRTDARIEQGDTLIAIGDAEAVRRLIATG